ncbi:hypothetical protein VCRA2119O147_690027 [Vibrio crassostreae]|nr:hypothetical protein VCRA2113O322_180062 [Vibrio crassostreae]CAK1882545.1 hypothetical protein VCRA2114E123_200018 [Vibrio crassostreae]CAK1892070.1 hypothetical protein VCRA2118O236_210018 [Vibrio crassostreae]CAK1903586.1 hypothetical protein VCRA2114E122_220018 [Vibrio crassostreae]CAK1911221.1 hypothetical protein VCRA2113O324_210018 [Vibrio crassostreae]
MIFKFNTSVKTKKGEQLKPLTFLFFPSSPRVKNERVGDLKPPYEIPYHVRPSL